jgi:uncharacterized membrane protein
MTQISSLTTNVSPEEYRLLQQLRARKPGLNPPKHRPTWGERISDRVATVMGSWRFIIIQSVILAIWIILNVVGFRQHWDPYPFILLNLLLSFQAAYAAPIIIMSQNRQASIDRADARNDYEVNQKVELEIEHMQDKIDALRGMEVVELRLLLEEQRQQLGRLISHLIDQSAL